MRVRFLLQSFRICQYQQVFEVVCTLARNVPTSPRPEHQLHRAEAGSSVHTQLSIKPQSGSFALVGRCYSPES